MAEKPTGVAPREPERLSRQEPSRGSGPFRMLERFADEIDNVFSEFGVGRGWLSPRLSKGRMWTPEVEVSHQNNELVVRADLPGMKKDEVAVDISDDQITISGERRQEEESERGGLYRSERRYGSFLRTIPLPDGAMSDQARATFKDGVLEIRMPAPPEQANRGRRLEISEGESRK